MFFHIVKPNFKDIRLLSIVCLYKTHNIGFVLQHTMIYHSASTTTQLTSHVYKFPLTHEISLGHLSFFSGHYDLGFSRHFPQTHRWGRVSLFVIMLSFATRILQSTSHDRGPTRSLLFRGWT